MKRNKKSIRVLVIYCALFATVMTLLYCMFHGRFALELTGYVVSINQNLPDL